MSSSAGVSSNKSRRTAYAAAAAAKDRRQKIIAAVLGVVLVLVLVYEVPHLLKSLRGSKTTVAPSATTPTQPKATPAAVGLLDALRKTPAVDPFAQPIPAGGDPAPRNVAVPRGSVDPFTGKASAVSQTSAPPTSVGPLPERIVIGKPGGGRVAKHGWIVILASIPTAQGKASATSFASKARGRGLSPVSVLNSSNRKPLRGGYWVVYTGPYATLSGVTRRAGNVHGLGYPTAYIRELIVYR
jgi:hypothetical protein